MMCERCTRNGSTCGPEGEWLCEVCLHHAIADDEYASFEDDPLGEDDEA